MNSLATLILGTVTVLLVARGAKPDPGDPAKFIVLWKSIDGRFFEEAGWLGWWAVVEHGTIFNKGKPAL